MPQKHPPATTAVSWDFAEARGASTAGLGNAALALARPSLGCAVAQASTPIPAKISTATSTARIVLLRKRHSIEVYACRNRLDVPRLAHVVAPDCAGIAAGCLKRFWLGTRCQYEA